MKKFNDQSVTCNNIVLEGQVFAVQDAFMHREKNNKEGLVRVYIEHIATMNSKEPARGVAVYTSGEQAETTKKVTRNNIEHVESLKSNQEADSRVILYCIYAARKGAKKIIVQSPDTDDLVLPVHHWPAIKAKEIYFMKAVQGKHINLKRFIPVHDLHKKLSQEL